MSLVNRVSIFFLASLMLVLLCYSVALYGTLRHQLQQHFDDQLQSAFHVLVAAVEVEVDDVKFEPSDHTIALGSGNGEEDIRWTIYDERGRVVDRSRNLIPELAHDRELLDFGSQLRSDNDSKSTDIGHWRVLQKRLAAISPKPAKEREPDDREALVVTVARSPHDLNVLLRFIGGLVIVLPLVVGTAAAIVGRRICQRALQPLHDMVAQARLMSNSDVKQRIPVGASRDELAELGEAFNAVLDRLYESLERQRQFAGDAAHQLRTPLTTVIGHLDVALRRPRTAGDYRDVLAIARNQANELQQIIESLLYLARPENETDTPGMDRVLLSKWFQEYLPQWSLHARYSDLALNVPADVEVFALPVLLKQLLDNLIGNAFKYSAAGTSVWIAAEKNAGQVEISVTDQGTGIAAHDLPEVFRPFFRSDEARRSGVAGTGLGLAVASRIAAALHGHLSCQSELGKGSRFVLTIPKANPASVSQNQSRLGEETKTA